MTHLFVKLRNQADLEAIVEEVSAVYDRDTFKEIYKTATDEPYAFLYINLIAKDKRNTFDLNFESRLIPSGYLGFINFNI